MQSDLNVVLIVTDQFRADTLGISGHPLVQTPNLDALASGGCRFRRAYAESPTCIPARRSLISGTAPAANGMVGYRGDVPWDPSHTLPGELSRHGYQTQLVGKLNLHPPRKRFGFDHLVLSEATRGNDDYNEYLIQNGVTYPRAGVAHGVNSNGWVGRPNHLPEHLTHAFWCTSRAIEFIEKRDPSCPFCLNLSFIDPHPPFTPPAFYYDRYVQMDLPEPVVGDWSERAPHPQKGLPVASGRIHLDRHAMQQMRAAYYGMVNFVDDQIGRLLNHLGDRGLLRKTLIVFTSDHGEMLGDHGLFRKGQPFQASANIPLIVKGTAELAMREGHVSDDPVGLQDVMPTILDLAGIAVPETCTGRSLAGLMRGESRTPREFLHGEHARHADTHDGMHYIVDQRFKYIWFSRSGAEHLFDLMNDPCELRDLSSSAEHTQNLWQQRRRLVDVLKDRPEPFVRNGELACGVEHDDLVPGYEPSSMFPFR